MSNWETLTVGPHIKGLIFDCDGTLVDTMPHHYWAWQETLKRYQAHFPEPLFYQLAGVPSDRLVIILNEKFGYTLEPEAIAEEKESKFLKHLKQVTPIGPVVSLAKQYKGQLPLAVATGGIPPVVKEILTILELGNGFFDAIVTAEDVENGKPAPDTFLEAARQINIAPEHCQVFEDSDMGLAGAREAGMFAIDIRPYYDTWRNS